VIEIAHNGVEGKFPVDPCPICNGRHEYTLDANQQVDVLAQELTRIVLECPATGRKFTVHFR